VSAQLIASGSPLAGAFQVSAVSGNGLSELVHGICEVLKRSHGEHTAGAPLLLRARHQRAVREAKEELELFLRALESDELPMSVAGTHLRASAGALESLIGAVGVEDVLDRVFSSFCVGK
jgi:tRNA modification GTPase